MKTVNNNVTELSRENVNLIADPVQRAALLKLLNTIEEAPPIPGLAALEAQYGAGKVPMNAVHESNELSFEDKKFLFKIAGFDYDGTKTWK